MSEQVPVQRGKPLRQQYAQNPEQHKQPEGHGPQRKGQAHGIGTPPFLIDLGIEFHERLLQAFGFFRPKHEYLGRRKHHKGDDKQQETQGKQGGEMKVRSLAKFVG